MDYKSIINLMKEMSRTDLTRLEIEEDGVHICLEKAPMNVPVPVQALIPNVMQTAVQSAAPAAGEPVNAAAVASASVEISSGTGEAPAADTNLSKQVSPMVGTFYAQPSPDKAPFVKVGDRVKKGQTLCIIEAMKLLNEIESEYDGEIVEVLVKNEEMVEFGQPLFLIR